MKLLAVLLIGGPWTVLHSVVGWPCRVEHPIISCRQIVKWSVTVTSFVVCFMTTVCADALAENDRLWWHVAVLGSCMYVCVSGCGYTLCILYHSACMCVCMQGLGFEPKLCPRSGVPALVTSANWIVPSVTRDSHVYRLPVGLMADTLQKLLHWHAAFVQVNACCLASHSMKETSLC